VPSIRLRDNEPFEVRFAGSRRASKRKASFSEVKKREAYEKPSVKKKKKRSRRGEGGKDRAPVQNG